MKNKDLWLNKLILYGMDDWVEIDLFEAVVKQSGQANSERERRDMAMELIRQILADGIMVAGNPYPDPADKFVPSVGGGYWSLPGKFAPWPLTPKESADRIEKEWQILDRRLSWGEICCFNLTELGEKKGTELMKSMAAQNPDKF